MSCSPFFYVVLFYSMLYLLDAKLTKQIKEEENWKFVDGSKNLKAVWIQKVEASTLSLEEHKD